MKAKIFNSGYGWYIPAFNYKDDNDKTVIKLFFPNHTEPSFQFVNDKAIGNIQIEEGKFNCYKGKVSLTVFKYSLIDEAYMPNQYSNQCEESQIIPMTENDYLENEQIVGDVIDEPPVATMDELPFY